MTYQEFKAKYLNQFVDDGFGNYKGQCVSLIKKFLIETGIYTKAFVAGNAKGLVDSLPKIAGYRAYPMNRNAVATLTPGDVLVTISLGEYGHTGLFDSYDPTTGLISSLEQNAGQSGTSVGIGDEIRVIQRQVEFWTHYVTLKDVQQNKDELLRTIQVITNVQILLKIMEETPTSSPEKTKVLELLNTMEHNARDYYTKL